MVKLEEAEVPCKTAAWIEQALKMFGSIVLTKRYAHVYGPVAPTSTSSVNVNMDSLRSGQEAARKAMLGAISEGRPDALLAAQNLAVLGLVTGDIFPGGLLSTECPELFWNQLPRLLVMRDEFEYNVGMAIALVAVQHHLCSLKNVDWRRAMKELSTRAYTPFDFKTRKPRAEDVPAVVMEALQAVPLTAHQKMDVKALVGRFTKPTGKMWKLMRDRMASVWSEQMRRPDLKGEQFVPVFKSIGLPRVAFPVGFRACARAVILQHLAKMSRSVHSDVYTNILRAKARAVRSEFADSGSDSGGGDPGSVAGAV